MNADLAAAIGLLEAALSHDLEAVAIPVDLLQRLIEMAAGGRALDVVALVDEGCAP